MVSFTVTVPAPVTVNLNQSMSVLVETLPLTGVPAATRLLALAAVLLDSVSWVMMGSGAGPGAVMVKAASLVSEVATLDASLTRTFAAVVAMVGTV
jgi:hypothetical protein